MIVRSFFTSFCVMIAGVLIAQTNITSKQIEPEQYKIISTDRHDARYVSTRGFVQYMLRNAQPQLAFNPHFSKEEFRIWQNQVRERMQELMQFPDVPPQPLPKLLSKKKRDGYTLEKWEIYPQPGSVVPFLMLVPDGVSYKNPAPAVLCFSGSSGTKETLAGEDNIVSSFTPRLHEKNMMARFYAKQGMVAIAMDHPGMGESSDLEIFLNKKGFETRTFSRYLLDLGWSFLGLSAFQGQQVYNWMKTLDFVKNEKIAVSGHSLGTEPAMALAVINPDICAVVYNDFMCSTRKRLIVLTKPTVKGSRPYYNGLCHFPPNYLKWFDYPDIVASLSPRPIIITEGGNTSDLDFIKESYKIMDAEDNIVTHYYEKYNEPITRKDYVDIPEGLDKDEYFQYVNVDAPNHYFKAELAVPWLKNIFLQKQLNN